LKLLECDSFSDISTDRTVDERKIRSKTHPSRYKIGF